MPKTIHVAVGVIINKDREILIALRPNNSHQGGLWEFPGGKVESNETVQQALSRELFEELGVQSSDYRPMMNVRHDYGDKLVLLDVWWVDTIDGHAFGREGQEIKWVKKDQLVNFEFPKANMEIIKMIKELNIP